MAKVTDGKDNFYEGSRQTPQSVPQRLPGMEDLAEAEYLHLQRAQAGLQGFFSSYGYRMVETPVLEPTEIFLRKSGGELASRMYTFTDPGGHRVSLRPEFTSAAIRLFLEQPQGAPLPVRWQYAGPVFRYEGDGSQERRQFTQVGVELIGAAGSRADAEMLALVCQALTAQGLSGLQLVVGDVGAVHALLRQFDLSERALLFLLESIGEIRKGEEGLAQVRRWGERLGLYPELGKRERELDPAQSPDAEEAQRLAQSLPLQSSERPVGVRTPDEIRARLLRKLQVRDTPERLERALEFVAKLSMVRDSPLSALAAARRLVRRYGLNAVPLASLTETLAALQLHELKGVEVTLDLGLARGIAYYTGTVFDVHHAGGVSLGGGGRYDGLVKALGSQEDVPALGFACILERVVAAQGQENEPAPRPRHVLVAPRELRAYGQALKVAKALRLGGEVVEVALEEASSASSQEYAKTRGIDAVVLVEEDGASQRNST